MADELASLTLSVTGDISPVEQALNQLPVVAQQAAANIDQALSTIADGSSTATAGLQSLNDSLAAMWQGNWSAQAEQFDSALQGVGGAAGEAAPKIEQTAEGARHAGESAQEAGGAFGEWKDKIFDLLTELGLLVGAVEALKEILDAVATEQAFLVSMEALTGSAETAESTLRQLETTAVGLPVAFDSLLQATQRMQAFGVATQDIPNMLRAAADAAAASGQAFDTVAQGLERVQVTGTVMARSLMQMGITWAQVAAQMGVSVEQAQAAFKKGAQSAEEDVRILVATIENNFGGMSSRIADTLGGTWQIIKNQLVLLAGDIGQLLAPALMAIASVVRGVLQTFIDFFDTIKAGLAWMGSTGTAILGAVTAAIGLLGIALDMLSGPVGIVLAGISLLLTAFSAMQSSMESVAEKQERLRDEQKIASDDMAAEQKAADALSAVLARHGLIVDQAGQSTAQFSQRLQALWDDFSKTNDMIQRAGVYWTAYKGILSDLFPSMEAFENYLKQHLKTLQDQAHDASMATINDQYRQLQTNLTNAKAHLDLVTEAYRQHHASLGQLQEAQSAVDKATQALTGTVAKHESTTRQDTLAINDASKALIEFAKRQQEATVISQDLNKYLDMTVVDMDHFRAVVENLHPQLTASEKAVADLEKQMGELAARGNTLSESQQAQLKALQIMLPLYKEWAENISISETALAALNIHVKEQATLIPGWADAVDNVAEAYKTLGLQSQQTLDDTASAAQTAFQIIVDSGTASAQTIQDAWEEMTKRMMAAGDELSFRAQFTFEWIKQTGKEKFDTLAATAVHSILQIRDAIARDLSKALSDLIFHAGSVGDAFKKLGQDVVSIILDQIIKLGIQKLIDKLGEVLNVIGSISNAFGGSGAAGSAIGAAANAAAGAAGAGGGAAGSAGSAIGAAASGGGGAGSTVSSLMSGALGWASLGVDIVSGIVSGIQGAHTNSLLDKIEKSTRFMWITIGEASDSLYYWTKTIGLWTQNEGKTELFNIDANTLNCLNVLNDISNKIGKAGSGGMFPVNPGALYSASPETPVSIDTVNITVDGSSDPVATARAISTHLRTFSRRFATR